MQADGRALPGWLNRAGPELLVGERPADSERVELRIIAVLSDGTTIERDVVIQTSSGVSSATARNASSSAVLTDVIS